MICVSKRCLRTVLNYANINNGVALALALLILFSNTAQAQEPGEKGTRPDLVGLVGAGDARPKATIFIFTAGPKVGTSTFCPSCYADCRKKGKSDAKGEFKIESLDPQLLFRVLVVAKGYKPKFVPKVDPAAGPIMVELEAVESREVTPDKSIRGRVIDPEGKPVEGAVVEAHGIRKKNDLGSMWGQLPGVDPLAVTDEQGEFLLTSREPFLSLDVRVEARAFAHKQFNKLASGSVRHTLAMTEGAAVKGRVLWSGKPLTRVSVGMVGADRGVEDYAGNYDVGTDVDGRFLFVNLPPNRDYFIYGLMSTIKTNGAISIRKIHPGDDGATLDVGDLTVESAQRLSGQIVCADGQSVPAKTRLLVGREEAWDTMQLELDKDGRFDTTGVPKETLSLSARIPGYRLASRNLSLDLMNPFHLIGRVDHDITNIVILLEKGSDLRNEFDSQLPESEWPRNRPLRGAEAAPNHSSQYIVSGKLRDADTKALIPQFIVTAGNSGGPLGRISWNKRNSSEGTNGTYLLYFDKRYNQPVLKVEAEGYLPGQFTMQPNSRTNFDLTLQRGSGPTGTVLLPDGQPAQGASIALLCLAENEVGLRADGTLQAWQHKDLIQFTDPDGSFALKPELDMKAVVVTTKEGFKLISVLELATNSKVVLEAWGNIKGVLHRGENLSTNEDIDLALEDGSKLNLQYHTMTDNEGRFEFSHVPPGKIQINGRNMVSQRGWTWDPLDKVTLKPGEDLKIDIRAATRHPVNPTVEGPLNRPRLVRKTGTGPSGRVFLPNGKPAADAEVALMVKNQYVAVGKGTLRAYEARQEGLVVRADSEGRFSLPSIEATTGLVVVHEQGYAHVLETKFGSAQEITLEAWGQVEGILHIGRRLGTNEQVSLQSGQMAFGASPLLANEDYQARTDESGRFIMRFVPPGEHRITRMIPTGNGSWQGSMGTVVTVKPGVVTQVSLGGDGQTVTGKVHITGREVNFQNVHASLHTRIPDDFKKVRTPEEQIAWSQTPEAKLARKNYRGYSVIMEENGSFRAEEVLPGKYELDIMLLASSGLRDPSGILGRYHSEVVVPEPKGKDDTSPTDLGVIECEEVRDSAASK